MNKGLGDPSGEVRGRSVDFTVVLARERTATVSTPSAVGVDDDLAAGQTSITLWSTDDEKAGWLKLDRISIFMAPAQVCNCLHGTRSCRRGTSRE
jgi:hypothetical protein